jgi:NAD+ kinase
MTNRFKRIGLWGRFSEDSLAEPARLLVTHLNGRGIEVCATDGSDELSSAGKLSFFPEAALGDAVDLLVAIGGDGNLLRATRCVAGRDVPLIGINRGRLGFLTDVKPEQMLAALDAVLDGDFLAEERLMLAARIRGPDGVSESAPHRFPSLPPVVPSAFPSWRADIQANAPIIKQFWRTHQRTRL